jgi:hypothetical protein
MTSRRLKGDALGVVLGGLAVAVPAASVAVDEIAISGNKAVNAHRTCVKVIMRSPLIRWSRLMEEAVQDARLLM